MLIGPLAEISLVVVHTTAVLRKSSTASTKLAITDMDGTEATTTILAARRFTFAKVLTELLAPLNIGKPPWQVKYSGANRGFAGIMCYGDQPNPALLAEAINGMVLAAVEIEDEKAFRREPQTPNGRPRFIHTRGVMHFGGRGGGSLWRGSPRLHNQTPNIDWNPALAHP